MSLIVAAKSGADEGISSAVAVDIEKRAKIKIAARDFTGGLAVDLGGVMLALAGSWGRGRVEANGLSHDTSPRLGQRWVAVGI